MKKISSKEEKMTNSLLLHKIVSNPASFGAFSGMIFNARVKQPNIPIRELVSQALEVKRTILDMSNGE